MALSKKLRFEVFKRDDFRCAYCGKVPPEITLEIDHINPKSKGGGDSIDNLLSACFDCNRGKRNIPLDKIPNKMAFNIKVLEEKEAQFKEYNKMVLRAEKRTIKDAKHLNDIYSTYFPSWSLSKRFVKVSLRRFQKQLPLHIIEDALHSACIKRGDNEDEAIKYFCGICWRKIKGEEKY